MTPRKKWGGTLLFAAILTVLGATVGLRMYGTGESVASTSVSAAQPLKSSTPSATATPTPTASASASASATATPTPSAAATRTIVGDAVQTPYGPMQVQLTVSGKTITAVDTPQYPNGSGRDAEINSQALPILDQEVMQSQSANIDTVSGATYTSEGYIQSLQSALDKL